MWRDETMDTNWRINPRGRGGQNSRGEREEGGGRNYGNNSRWGNGNNNDGYQNNNGSEPGRQNSRGGGGRRGGRNYGNNSRRGNGNNNDGNGRNNDRREFEVRRMGFKQAESLGANEDVEEVVQKVLNDRSGFNLVLEDSQLSGDWLCLVVHILGKVSRSSFIHSKLKIYKDILVNSSFPKQLKIFIIGLPYQSHSEMRSNKCFWDNSDQFWMSLIEIFKDITASPTFASENLPTLIKAVVKSIPDIEEEKNMHISEGIKEEFSDLKLKVDNMKETMVDRYHSQPARSQNRGNEDDWVPPEDFRTINVLPNVQEVTCIERPFLRCNKVEGSYQSIDHYLDVQFRLLREDFVKPLREGICQFLKDPRQKHYDNIKIHRKVHFLSEENINELKCFRIKFEFGNKKKAFKLEHSKQFMFGSLVCLSRDRFLNLLFAKIVKRDADMTKNGELVIGFENNIDINIAYNVDYIMVESKVYFEPYYHVLMAMQKMSNESFPMKEFIIYGESTVYPPEYMDDNLAFNIEGRIIRPATDVNWDIFSGLNDSQRHAFRAALSQEISVIQGPPGTGKTFLGLKVADTLLRNKTAWFKNTPMLVICFTNHALDQFLEGILKSTNKLLRIGGQSKNENLQNYTLRNKKRVKKSAAFYQAQREMSVNLSGLKVYDNLINEIRQYNGVVDFARFHGLVDEIQGIWYETASKEEIKNWLFEGSRGYIPPAPPQEEVGVPRHYDNPAGSSSDEDELSDSENEEEEGDEEFADILNRFGSTGQMKYCVSFASLNEKISAQRNTIMVKGSSAAAENSLRQLQNELKFLQEKMDDLRNDRMTPVDHVLFYRPPFNLTHKQRWCVYNFFIKQCLSRLMEKREEANKVYQESYRIYTEQRDMEDVKIMRESLVIGMTTTSAARLRSTLEALKSPIVIVEEAAEVLEAHLISALTLHCQQLILIGDHQQLRPTTADYHVETRYQMGVSLFERLVRNDVQCYTLAVQHRMRPEICNLIRPAIYAKLEDHETVKKRENIKGLNTNLFFLTHTEQEANCGDATKKNIHEVKFLICLAKHLILNGYKPHQITILAAYLGQMFEMQREKRKNSLLLKDVRISVLDNYQGEESDIILLSLVRNNEENKNGFLKTTNRVCVALSRARDGLYIMGNMEQLCRDNGSIWHQIKAKLMEQHALGDSLALRCQVHGVITKVRCEEDFNKAPEGGCTRVCNANLPNCSHLCKSLCHLENRNHDDFKCMEVCGRKLCTRSDRHVCPARCYEKCNPCHYPMRWKLRCDHVVTLQCHEDPLKHKCVFPVESLLPCGHKTESKPCHVRPEDFTCPVDCKATVDCGHVCTLKCHDRRDPDHVWYICPKPCERHREGCSTKGHKCRKLCHQECEPCTVLVKKQRTCSHVSDVKCNSNVEEVTCNKPCKRNLICGHLCKNKCCDTCGPCEMIVEKVIATCGHKVKIQCGKEPSRINCEEKCERKLNCGHVCVQRCKAECPTKCKQMVACKLSSPCGHMVNSIKCFENPVLDNQVLTKYCTVPCETNLQCQHKCPGTCGKCFQGRVHARCLEKCGVPMVCNHECPVPCRQTCRPCEKKCTHRCDHGYCTKKCGEICVLCMEKCSRKCAHQKCENRCSDVCSIKPCTESCRKSLKCGHRCVGFCGDPCPKLCGICDREELTEVLFGTEEDEDARFVQLKDCGHVLESSGMEMWLQEKKEGEIQIKVCPKCKTPIINTQRYSEYLKNAILDIQKIKKRMNGTREENSQLRQKLLARLQFMNTNTKIDLPKISATFRETESRLKETKVDAVRGVVRQTFDAVILNSITSKVQIMEHITKIVCVAGVKPSDFQTQLDFIFDCMNRNEEHITNQEIDDIQLEINRLKRMVELSQIKKRFASRSIGFFGLLKKPDVKTQETIKRIEVLVNTPKRYPKVLDEDVEELMKTLNSGIQISESERVEIVKAFGLKQGHWFKCPNGHPYIITECGGAMVESKCPEAGCGEKIGGTQHSLLGTNQLASEMDGARFAAWSDTANNMNNYDMQHFRFDD